MDRFPNKMDFYGTFSRPHTKYLFSIIKSVTVRNEINFYPTMSDNWLRQISSKVSKPLSIFRLGREIGSNSDKSELYWKYKEVIQGNLTALITEFCSEKTIHFKSFQLPVNDIYIFHIESRVAFAGKMEYPDWKGVFFSANESISVEVNPESVYRSVYISISRAYLLGLLKDLEIYGDKKYTYILANNQSIYYPFELDFDSVLLATEFFDLPENLKKNNDLALALKIKRILLLLLRGMFGTGHTKENQIKISDYIKMKNVVQTLKTDLVRKHRLEELAETCKMSKIKFSRIFRQVTGKSYPSFYTQIRMERALKLLTENETDSITQLATLLGYNNIQEFSRAFAKYYGYTPKYIQRIGGRNLNF